MKSQDIIVLLKIALLHQRISSDKAIEADAFSARGLEAALGISKTEVNASIKRSIGAGLALKDRTSGYPKANINALLEFIVHGLRYVFPVQPGAMVRGMATAAAAPVLQKELMSAGDTICVWPDAEAKEMGQSLNHCLKAHPSPQNVIQSCMICWHWLMPFGSVTRVNPR
jgi:hypothetical protein